MGNLWQKISQQQSIWLTILTLAGWWGCKPNSLHAQIIPDNTLGAENSIVNQINETLQQIDGGAIRGSNLFHSFLEFSINEGNAAYFNNPAEVLNIFSRVTGNNISQILGTLGVLGDANLYLINPNGILFGPNALIDIAGSFVASSGNSIIFADGTEFSATNPQAPPLLTVNTSTPIGLKFEGIPGTITSQAELITAPQKTIALVGGDVNIEGGAFIAEDGRIELGSVGNNSIVNFTTSELGLLALDYSQANNFTDLSLSDFASLDTSGDRGGEIQLQGQNISLRDDTFILSTTFGIENGGNLTFNAIESINLTGFATIIIESRGEGNGGNIFFNSNQINLRDEILISADAHDIGNAGEIIINVNESLLLNDLSSIYSSNNVEATDAVGNGGNITINSTGLIDLVGEASILTESWGKGTAGSIVINTNDLSVQELTFIGSSAHDEGKGGNLIIQASQLVDLGGVGLFTDSNFFDTGATGNAGNISIEARQIIAIDGANINSSTSGDGDGGNITINASDSVKLMGFLVDGDDVFPSGIGSQSFGEGNSGNIMMKTPTLIIEDGASLTSSTFGGGNSGEIFILEANLIELNALGKEKRTAISTQTARRESATGNANDITIETQQLNIFGGAQILSVSRNNSKGGDININASESIVISGTRADATLTSGSSGIFVSAEPAVVDDSGEIIISAGGGSGNLFIETNNLLVEKGAKIFADTFGLGKSGEITLNVNQLQVLDGGLIRAASSVEENAPTLERGDGGTLNINATGSVTVSGVGNVGKEIVNSSLVTEAQGINGDAGVLTIDTPQLIISNQGIVSASTSGQNADANDIVIDNANSVTIDNGLISSAVNEGAIGNGGKITINTNNLALQNGGVVTASTSGEGNAGNVTINAENINIADGSNVFAFTESQMQGDAGDIKIQEAQTIFVSGESALQTFTSNIGEAGNIFIDTQAITISEDSDISAFTSGGGDAGNITVNATESLTLNTDTKLIVESSGAGTAGEINIDTPLLTIGENAQLSATATETSTSPTAGDINLNVNQLNIAGELGIFAETRSTADAGSLTIKPYQTNPNLNIQFTDEGFISARTTNIGDGGSITITAPKSIDIRGLGSITAETRGSGDAGSIYIDTQNLNISNGVKILALTTGAGNAGNISIIANQVNLNQNSEISASNNQGRGDAGNIYLSTRQLELNNQSKINAFTDGMGNAGQITITDTDLLYLDNSSKISTAIAPSGIASQPSNIEISSRQVFLNNNSQITAETEGQGKGGNINLNAQQLTLENGSIINTTTSGESQAGNINLIISEEVNIIGTKTRILADTTEESRGKGGNIDLRTTELLIEKGGIIAVDSLGEGQGGNITISNNNLSLNQGTISAETTSGDGGDINLTVNEFLTMRNGSIISTTAGNQQTGGNGGNINIFARYILAIPEENSDITANAFTGKGGQIFIATEAIFGIEPRDELTFLSDITASSELGVDGIIEITRLNVDPLEGLTNLPETRADVVVAQGCDVGGEGSISFYDLGKGGLPAKPGDYLIIDDIFTPWIPLMIENDSQSWNFEKNQSVKISNSDTNIILTFSCGDD